jgi:hypothetical protein
MTIRGIKPRTHLIIDLLLFALLCTVAISALVEHAAPAGGTHLRFMVHRIHGVAGIAMCLTISVHLFLHLPWIKSQLGLLLSGSSRTRRRLPTPEGRFSEESGGLLSQRDRKE